MLKAVIFDMDGVLVDTEPLYDEQRIAYTKKRFNVDIDKEFMSRARGLSAKSFFELLFTEFKITHSIEEVVQHSRDDYFEFLKNHPDLKPIDGVVDLINQLHKEGILLAVASSASSRRINFILELLNVKDKFQTISHSDIVEKGKPHPDIYLKAAQLLGVDPKDCVAIEDATNGVKSAKAAGMKVIGFRNSSHNTQDLSEADLILRNFNELSIPKIKSLFS